MPSFQPHLPHPNYRPDIDGLRAVAILSVVAFHAFPTWVTGGFIGVDIFFAISGYLISTIILKKLAKGTFSFRSFYARRINRIFPALILVLATTYAFGWFALLPDEFRQLSQHIAGGAGFVSNFVLWNEVGYFDNSATTKPLLHLWSLGIEEQFYIMWPLSLWLAWKVKFNLLAITMLVALASFGLNVKVAGDDTVAAFYLPHTRSWELFCGSILAWLNLYRAGEFPSVKVKADCWPMLVIERIESEAAGIRLPHVFSGIGFLMLAFGFAQGNKSLCFPGGWAVAPVLGAALIILAGPNAWFNRFILSNRVAVWFGLISFPLYLWHWPILCFLHIIEGEDAPVAALIIAVALSVVLAWITFIFVEQPIRYQPTTGGSALCLVVSMVALGLAGFSYRAGFYEKYWRGTQMFALSKSASISPRRADCHFGQKETFKERKVCEYAEGTKIKVAVLGNSHGVELAFALSERLKEYGVGLRHLTMSGCPISYKLRVGKDGRHSICVEWHDFAVKSIIASDDIRVVVLSYRIESDARHKMFRDSMYGLIDDLVRNGKRVVLVLQAPMLDRQINYYIRRAFGRHQVVNKPLGDWKEQYKSGYLIAKTVEGKVPIVDPADVMCDDQFCYAIRNNKSLFFNSDHMSVEGALLVATKLFPVVMELLNEPLH
jgi:peptidoglycan/LPS O-acetylase OafA/YrhL